MEEIFDGIVGGLIDLVAGASEVGVDVMAEGTSAANEAAANGEIATSPEPVIEAPPAQDGADDRTHDDRSVPQRSGDRAGLIDLVPDDWPSGGKKDAKDDAQAQAADQATLGGISLPVA